MRDTTIEWTTHTWNPWHGCRKVSPGCLRCYMYTAKSRYGQDPRAVVRSRTTWQDPLTKWRVPGLIFTCSWSDFFIEEADGWRAEAWDVIRRTPWHTYQILTKRPERMRAHIPWVQTDTSPWPHVWLGVSVETQPYAEARIPLLLDVPAAVRFLSLEPLLRPVNLAPYLAGIGWVICGGESGPGYRPMEAAWARAVRDACVAADIPLFFKQWGGRTQKAGGKVLDGREWCEFPRGHARSHPGR